MRNRSRIQSPTVRSKRNSTVSRSYTFHPEFNSVDEYTTEIVHSSRASVEAMSDDVSSSFKVFGASKRSNRSAASRLLRKLQVHPCSHQKTVLELLPFTRKYSTGFFLGSDLNERVETFSDFWEPGGYWFDSAFPTDPLAYMQALPRGYSADPFITPDWFSLQDSFNEACDSFLPSSLLAGETIIEGSIFIDALKIVINPSNAIKTLIKSISRHKKLRKSTLGEISRISRTSASTLLGFEFGVTPAIEDVKHAIEAHRKVESRLRYLRTHSGQYVPVRVRRRFSSSVSNDTSSGPNTYRLGCSSKETIGTLGCYGRVREDLDWKDTWISYMEYFGLNKIIGLAWELIPFSFVVDWFTNAQERINNLTRFRTGGPFADFIGFTASLKTQLVEEYIWTPHNDSGFSFTWLTPDTDTVLARLTTSSYDRYLKVPDTSGVVDLSTLGTFQLITGGALILQRYLK